MPKFVDVETARAASGLRLVTLAGVPSLWSEAAKGIFHVKRLDFVAVRMRVGDATIAAWTGRSNAPVAMWQDEPARDGWADILALAERLSPEPRLVPASPAGAAEVHALCELISGRDGLMWSARLLLIHASLSSDGQRGLPVPISRHLAQRYGYSETEIPEVRKRVEEILRDLGDRVSDSYVLGDQLTAADIHLAAATACLAPFPDEHCLIQPGPRRAFSAMNDEVAPFIPTSLLAHRDRIYRQHLEFPIQI